MKKNGKIGETAILWQETQKLECPQSTESGKQTRRQDRGLTFGLLPPVQLARTSRMVYSLFTTKVALMGAWSEGSSSFGIATSSFGHCNQSKPSVAIKIVVSRISVKRTWPTPNNLSFDVWYSK